MSPLFRIPLVVLTSIMASASAAHASPYSQWMESREDVVAYWSFLEDTTDSSGEHTGALRGGILTHFSGPIEGSGSVSLEDGRYLMVENDGWLDQPAATFELFYRPSASRKGTNPAVFAIRESESRLSVHMSPDRSHFVLWNGHRPTLFFPEEPVENGRWYHLTVSADASRFMVWLDGKPLRLHSPEGGWNLGYTKLPLYLSVANEQGLESLDARYSAMTVYSSFFTDEDVAAHLKTIDWPASREAMEAAEKAKEATAAEELAAELKERRKTALQDRFNDPVLKAEGETRIYRDPHLSAIAFPVGGLGSGTIQINGEAERFVWQIFNNYTQAKVADSFFAVRAQVEGADPVVRALQTKPVSGFPEMEALEFIGEYPFAEYNFVEPELPVSVSMRAWNPFIPGNSNDSAIPVAIFELTARNDSKAAVETSFLATQQNVVGFTGRDEAWARSGYKGKRDASAHLRDSGLWKDFGGNENIVQATDDSTRIHMTANLPREDEGFGDVVLMVNEKATATASWTDADTLQQAFLKDGKVAGEEQAGPSAKGETLNAALSVPFTLQPGESRTVTFTLAWHFPTYYRLEWWEYFDWEGKDPGNYYSTLWSDAAAVAEYVDSNYDRLKSETEAYHAAFYDSNLPYWLLDRVNSQNAILSSKTIGWSEGNWVTVNEGTNQFRSSCPYNNLYVVGYMQSQARLFPDFSRRIREQEFEYQAEDGPQVGKINTRLGWSHDLEGRVYPAAFDAMCFNVLGAYREHLMGTDEQWLAKWWPDTIDSMEYIINRWDKDGDGIMSGHEMGNTLDCHLSGVSSWLGTLYLASLEACERMARVMGDTESAERYRKIWKSGKVKQDEIMWNGEYYEQIIDTSIWNRADYGDGVAIDMLLGEWWASRIGLGPYYPEDHRRSALEAVFKYNFRTDFHGITQVPRKFADEDDAGMQMITWPEGTTRPEKFTVYSDEVMSGFEYSYAAACIENGLMDIALVVLRAAWERYDGRLRTGLSAGDNNAWGYSGNPFGDDEAGKFYIRALSVWSVLTAMQGYDYNGPEGVLGFAPRWQPEDHRSFFSAAEGWGTFSQKREASRQLNRIELRYGELSLNEFRLQLAEGKQVSAAGLRIGDKRIATSFKQDGRTVSIQLHDTLVLAQDNSLEIAVVY